MEISAALEYIHNVKWQRRKPGLGRTRALLASLGNPERSLRFVHVAGTNGKGSTSAYIASVMMKAGYRTGLFTSPHLRCVNERIQVDGADITDGELAAITGEIRPYADCMEDTPTEFELITALGMMHFRNKSCDIVVLEVGMGGELDSTNVIDAPEAAVITAIGFDHVNELGPTISDIAGAKAGIIKHGGDVVVYGGEAAVEAVFERVCKERDATLRKTDFTRITDCEYSLDGTKFGFKPYGELSIPLLGDHQPMNAALAITVLELLRGKGFSITDADIATGLAATRWPGRFEVLGREPTFILDGAHNPHAFKAVAESLERHFGGKKVVFITSVMSDKDVDAMIPIIAPLASAFFAVKINYSRAMDAGELAGRLSRYDAPVFAADTVAEGVAEAIVRAGKDGVVCAMGTLMMSDEVRAAYISYKAG